MILPELDSFNTSFWTGGKNGKLNIFRCQACGFWIHPPVPYCAACGSREVVAEAVSGQGTLYCCTSNHMPWMTDADEWQRIIALVELVEQRALRVLTNLVDCRADHLHNGMALEVTFRAFDDVYLPVFRPATERG